MNRIEAGIEESFIAPSELLSAWQEGLLNGAKGDGVTDDTQAFTDLESSYTERRIDLLGRTYLVSREFKGNYYYNGRFFINDGQTFLIEASSTSSLNSAYIKNGGHGTLLSRLDNFDVSTTEGAQVKVSQGTVIDLYTGEAFTAMPDELDGTLNRIEKHTPSQRVVASTSRSARSNQMGHQGLAIQYVGTQRKFWVCAGYSTLTTKGLKLNRIQWDGVEGSSFTNVEEFQIFPSTKSDGVITAVVTGNANSAGVSPNNQILVSHCAYYIKNTGQWQNFIRVFDTSVFDDGAGDYSNKYLYEFPVARFAGNTIQATATDGKFVYVLIAESTVEKSCTVLVYTLDGALVTYDNKMQVGWGSVLNNYFEPESFVWLPTTKGLQLGFAVATQRYGSRQYSTLLMSQGGYGNLLSPTSGESLNYLHGGIAFDSEKTFTLNTISTIGSKVNIVSWTSAGNQTNSSSATNYLSVTTTGAFNAALRVKNLLREGLVQASLSGLLGIFDTTNNKWAVVSNLDGSQVSIGGNLKINTSIVDVPAASTLTFSEPDAPGGVRSRSALSTSYHYMYPSTSSGGYQVINKNASGQAQYQMETLLRKAMLQISLSGIVGLYDTTNAKYIINSSADGLLTTIPSKTYISADLSLKPSATVTPANNGDLVFEATSNTSVTVKLKGSDGVVRSIVLNLN